MERPRSLTWHQFFETIQCNLSRSFGQFLRPHRPRKSRHLRNGCVKRIPIRAIPLLQLPTGSISKHELASNNQNRTALAPPGLLFFGAAASTAPVSKILSYGGGQTVKPNVQLPYVVRVTDVDGRPVYNALVTFTVETSGTVLSTQSATTNMNGDAQVTATSPSVIGDFTVRATAGSTSVAIKSTVAGATTGGGGGGPAPSGPKIIRVSGDGQLRAYLDSFGDPLVIRVEDGNGNPIAGKQVTWTEQGGVNFLPSSTTLLTDANGMAQAQVIPAGNFTAGIPFPQYSITANTDIGSTAFTLTAVSTNCTGGRCPSPQIGAQEANSGKPQHHRQTGHQKR